MGNNELNCEIEDSEIKETLGNIYHITMLLTSAGGYVTTKTVHKIMYVTGANYALFGRVLGKDQLNKPYSPFENSLGFISCSIYCLSDDCDLCITSLEESILSRLNSMTDKALNDINKMKNHVKNRRRKKA